MFVSHDKNVNKKKFQKPNILRRKSKIPSVKLTITTGSCESPETKSLAPLNINESTICDVQEETISQSKSSKFVQNAENYRIEPLRTNVDDVSSYEVQVRSVEGHNIEGDTKKSLQSLATTANITNHDETEHQNTLNVESFLVSGATDENITLFDNDTFQTKIVDLQGNPKWCFDFINNTPKFMVEDCEGSRLERVYLEQKQNMITTMVPMATMSSVQHAGSYIVPAEQIVDELTIHKPSVDQFFAKTLKFKCDVPECNKEFMSEQKLKKHKCINNKDGSTRVPRQTVVECPVKKINDNGTEASCGRVFQIRDELMKHLNEEHKPEDAIYRCEECGRRFFWASGLRAHGRAHRSRRPRAALACPWPGCGRVFRQPCRLREHSRAHTGDKPYPCRYPNCGWSFRTASKLMRHARRHTGERRHACAACGRAFLRREHLRDHTRRHAAARPLRAPRAPRARRACTHQGCEQTFANANSFYVHLKNFHRQDDDEEAEEDFKIETSIPEDDTQPILKSDSDDLYMVTYMPESPETDTTNRVEVEPENVELSLNVCAAEVEGVEGDESEGEPEGESEGEAEGEDFCVDAGELLESEEHAARTHCTWPLPSRTHVFEQSDDYVLEEDAHVEQSEISENNIYTVRSDLFLHGNVLTNEDSEHMGGAGAAGALDAELLLAPSVDIAQEELYTDAVDESSFRVFLLSGEDLT